MSDVVQVRGLVVATRVGVSDDERRKEQDVVINLVLFSDLADAGRTDELSDTIDYSLVISSVADLVSGGEFHLLEHMAEEVASLLLGIEGIDEVAVEVGKADPPVPERVREITVRIERP